MPGASQTDPIWDGGCRCGQLRVRVSRRPILSMACHCRGCQRMTASAFSLSVAIPSEGFAVTAGEPVIGALHGESRHYYCPHCLSWVFTRPAGLDWFVNLRTTLLDEPDLFPPFIETFTTEKLAWVQIPAAHSYPAFPPPEAYEGLMREYAAQASA